MVDPQPNQGWIGSWFRSKKAAGYKPDLVRALFQMRGEGGQGKPVGEGTGEAGRGSR